jgi:hypothetical protein
MIDRNELKMGIAVEKEHTQDDALAAKIAMDHLREDPRYYSKLKAAGLSDHGEESGQDGNIAVFTISAPETPTQDPLSSSGLGSGSPKPLKPTNLTAPETKVVNNKNTVVYSKTPILTSPCDPTAHFLGSVDQEIQEKW